MRLFLIALLACVASLFQPAPASADEAALRKIVAGLAFSRNYSATGAHSR